MIFDECFGKGEGGLRVLVSSRDGAEVIDGFNAMLEFKLFY